MKFKLPKVKKKNYKKKKSEINPNIYWNYVLYITFVLVVLSFGFGFYMFSKTNEDFQALNDQVAPRANTLEKERVDSVLDFFSTHQKKSEEIEMYPSEVVDPSL